jgi:hypothetical protein
MGRETDRVKLYVVTHKDSEGEYWTDLYMADNHDHAEEQSKNENPPDIEIVCTVRVPFYMVERAYYSGRAEQAL